jgi:hypothetical protein
VLIFFSENKYQLFKQFKTWIQDSGSPLSLIQAGRIQLWKKPMSANQTKFFNTVIANMQGKEAYFMKRRDTRTEKFLKLIDKDEF